MSDLNSILHIVIEVLKAVASNKMEDSLRGLLELILSLAENNPAVLTASKENLFSFLKPVISLTAFEDDIKILSLEILRELVTSKSTTHFRDEAPGLAVLSLEVLCFDTDEDEGNNISNLQRPNGGNYDDTFGCDYEMDLFESASSTFASLTEVVDPQVLVLSCLELASRLVSDSMNWRRRRAALLATSILAEECSANMQSFQTHLIPQLVASTQDENAKVRFAAMYVLESFAANSSTEEDENGDELPIFQENFHEILLPAILSFIQTNVSHPYLLHR